MNNKTESPKRDLCFVLFCRRYCYRYLFDSENKRTEKILSVGIIHSYIVEGHFNDVVVPHNIDYKDLFQAIFVGFFYVWEFGNY